MTDFVLRGLPPGMLSSDRGNTGGQQVVKEEVDLNPEDKLDPIYEALKGMTGVIARDLGVPFEDKVKTESQEVDVKARGLDMENPITRSLYESIIPKDVENPKVIEGKDDEDEIYIKAAEKMVKNIEKTRKAGKYSDAERKKLIDTFVANMKNPGKTKKKGDKKEHHTLSEEIIEDAIDIIRSDREDEKCREDDTDDVSQKIRPTYRGVEGSVVKFADPDGTEVTIWENYKNRRARLLIEKVVRSRNETRTRSRRRV